ncbi:uncharacterized protein SPPG_03082 [Spizellomyces punctatus DAOM BR117]|uniref:Glutathione S-transferase 3, mitochondrial n=1 Tax=Spizellomyces punctatus (strain DAOM BR117) TaxID=645134 RepID=A0A0L0HJI1_SPIPD|nr:uncharacterized protein SPPG_03082 [Spizellomyces punctatus DAOM BR117]KND01272.1 hypothetical protein SPPG_03082 [Spizellomyces punctatus DAOM BR117]|eukprot:XP_016609311.1 hypothetical protein SPPG_03082 [Spizellomyces punctatus DAOM BR117]
MAFTVTLGPEHGYVLGVAASTVILLQYLGFKAGSMRKKAGVPYPSLYADRAEAEAQPIKKLYNCYQRAHQNTLENYPSFLLLLGTAGISYPLFATACGATWVIGRLLYAHGYYSGRPERRLQGSIHILGLLGLFGASVKTIWDIVAV